MKLLKFILFFSLLLTACQTETATPISTASTPNIPTPTATKVKANSTPRATPTPKGPATHRSGTDPNAPIYLAVKDQFIVNNSLTIDTVTAPQAEFIVLYKDKQKEGLHGLGQQIIFAAIPAGKTNNLVILLSQNLNPGVFLSGLPGTVVDVVLQTKTSDPTTIVEVNNKIVGVTFTILSPVNSNPTSIFPTAKP